MPSVATSKPRSRAHAITRLRAALSSGESAARFTPPPAVAPISASAIWRPHNRASSTAAAAASASFSIRVLPLPP